MAEAATVDQTQPQAQPQAQAQAAAVAAAASQTTQTDSNAKPEQGRAPSMFGTFTKGFFGGIVSGALMGAIYSGVAVLAGGTGLGWGIAILAVSTGIFGGIMSMYRTYQEEAAAQRISRDLVREAETLAAARGINQQVDPRAANDPARAASSNEPSIDEQDLTNNAGWTARTSRNLRATNRIEALIDQGKQAEERKEHNVERLLRQREEAALREEAAYQQGR